MIWRNWNTHVLPTVSYGKKKIVWQLQKKLNKELPYDSENFTLRYIPKRTENISSHKNLYTNVHSSIIYIRQKVKQPKCPTNEWINELWYIHTMGYYSTIKKMKFWHMLQHIWILKTCKWRKPDTEDHKMIPFIQNVQNRQIHRDRKWIIGFQGVRVEIGDIGKWLLIGIEGFFEW